MRPEAVRTIRLLQRTAGNRAVARLLAPRPTTCVLQRYESPEHQDIGDRYFSELASFVGAQGGADWVKKYGLEADVRGIGTDPMLNRGAGIKLGDRTLTPGDVIALSGDFYASPEALEKANPKELEEILDAIGKERRGELSGAEANAAYQAITLRYRSRDQSFLELAKRNEPHFTPGNRKEWRRLHEVALALARGAKDDPKALNRALLTDAAAAHFLTDAFAAGHLFDKSKLELAIDLHLRQHPAAPSNPEMSLYYGLVNSQGAMGLLVLKNIHDRLNAEGVDVTNQRGMTWRTKGDARLATAPDTQRIAALAVFMSRQQIYQAHAGAEVNADAVMALLPNDASVERTTQLAISYIPSAAADVTALMYRQRGVAKTELPPILGPIITSNLATIAAPDRDKQIFQAQETARKTGLPTPAPQFTIASW
jgi:hypothetical protein